MIDLLDVMDDPIPGTFIYFEEDKIQDIYLGMVGPENTPYDSGFFFFHVRFNSKYPSEPPRVWFLTPNEKVRFNPNLYENGKVCLSILGTWTGPEWTSVMNLRSLILSLQSILSEHPIRNEPGFETESEEGKRNLSYNAIIRYSTLRFALLYTLNKGCCISGLQDKVVEFVHNNPERYNKVKEYIIAETKKPIETLKSMYGMKCTLDYSVLLHSWDESLGSLSRKSEG